jgi:hypothetical protein
MPIASDLIDDPTEEFDTMDTRLECWLGDGPGGNALRRIHEERSQISQASRARRFVLPTAPDIEIPRSA